MKLNIDLGKYVITGTKHDLILSERGIIKEGENAGKETLSRIGYYTSLSIWSKSYATVKSCYLRRRRYRIFSSISRL